MTRGIIINTSEYTKDFLPACLESVLRGKYPVLIVSNGGYVPTAVGTAIVINDWNAFEFGGLLQGKQWYDEFIHLADTTLIKDVSMFEKLFEMEGHVFLTKGGYHCMGKFVSTDLPDIPRVDNKEDAIGKELSWLEDRPVSFFEPDLPVHTQVFDVVHGQKRMRLENDYMIKWKGTYRV